MHPFIIMEVFVFGGAFMGWCIWEYVKTSREIERDKAEKDAEE